MINNFKKVNKNNLFNTIKKIISSNKDNYNYRKVKELGRIANKNNCKNKQPNYNKHKKISNLKELI